MIGHWLHFKDDTIGKIIEIKKGWVKVKYTSQNSGRWYEEHEIQGVITYREKCSYTRKYKGIRQPKCGCIECWDIYMEI